MYNLNEIAQEINFDNRYSKIIEVDKIYLFVNNKYKFANINLWLFILIFECIIVSKNFRLLFFKKIKNH